ncbi:GNAT family N-acetyltransferase [Bacillus sp. NPDC077411]|uniref:GNAT family N-acetyltransferase n=1 Tax=Bacillus bruguierae TaxID=3127667 RepID=A0ABU8FLL0_9BACI
MKDYVVQEQKTNKIQVVRADTIHIEGIAKICTDGWLATYEGLHSQEYIDCVIEEYYNHERIHKEVLTNNENWYGWFVALENEKVVGAIGGGTTGEKCGEIFVLYLDPNRRREGIGTLLVDYFTEIQKEKGIVEQWVSVAEGNEKGIPFYEAKGFVKQSERPSQGSTEEESAVSCRYCRNI